MKSEPFGPLSDGDGAAEPTRAHHVVGLGASAGGLDALEKFLSHVPAKTGLAFVVVQHLKPNHPSMLVELLSRHTNMRVVEVTHGMEPEPDHVYVVAPGTVLTLNDGMCRVTPAAQPPSTPIDAFFRSLAEDRGDHAIGVIFSGAGHDGTVGLRAIKERGGLTLAQTPVTAKHESMPRSAIEAGLVDHVLPPEQMAARILEHAGYITTMDRDRSVVLDEQLLISLRQICALVQQHTGHDFSHYKDGTLVRRIRRRIQVLHVGLVDDYLRLLERDAVEAEELVKDLLIGVTQFFRDPEAFQALAEQVVPRISQSKPPDAPFRIWVPGCASGEEAYSIAILMCEHLDRVGSARFVQIFATDLDAELLAEARQGRYPLSIAEHLNPDRLARFFVREGQTYQATKELREVCLFSQHSLIRDPPFSQLDLISCRNVLIYLTTELQRKLVPLFHYALRPGGFLFLGPSEGIAGNPELFEPLNKKHRIFRRKETLTRPLVEFPLAVRIPPRHSQTPAPGQRRMTPTTQREKLTSAFERMVLEDYSWPCVVVDERGEIIFVAGRVARYLQLSAGTLTWNLFEAVRGSLRIELRSLLQAAIKTGARVVRERVSVHIDDTQRQLRLIVRPMPAAEPESNLFAVVFQERLPAEESATEEEPGTPNFELPAVQHLEDELRSTRAELKTTVEELESANEELKSSNEELISTNEELQSANEEMQTSKEELQSLNEELETVNAELRQKVDELAMANSDLQNLFACTEIATIFLDRDLKIARFTPAATALIRLVGTDVGRSIGDFAPRFDGQDLVSDAREVLRTLKGVDRQVRTADGKSWFILRILPYRTVENLIAGVVVTFVDISAIKRAEEGLLQARARAEWLARFPEENPDPVLRFDQDFTILYANESARAGLGSLGVEKGKRAPDVLAELARQARREGHRTCGEVQCAGRVFYLTFSPVGSEVNAYGQDFTRLKQAEASMLEAHARTTAILESIADAFYSLDDQWRFVVVNPAAERAPFGRPASELVGKVIWDLFPAIVGTPIHQHYLDAVEKRIQQHYEAKSPLNGRWYEVFMFPQTGSLDIFLRDIDDRKKAEEALKASEERFRTLADNAQDSIARFDRLGRYQYLNPFVSRALGMPTDAILGRTADELGRNAEGQSWETQLREVFESGKPQRFDRKTVEGRWYDVQLTPEFRGSAVDTVLSFGRDVTERKQAEAALRESEQRYAIIHDKAPFAIGLARLPESTLVSVNDAFLRLFGYTREEVVGQNSMGVGIADSESMARVTETLRESGEVRDFECTLTTKSGDRKVVSLNASTVMVGGQAHALTTIQDITKRKRAEEALRDSERLYRAIGESIDYGVWVCQPDGRNVYASDSFLKLVGLTQQECSDFGWGNVLHPDDAEQTIAAWKECVRTGDVWSVEHRFRGVDGQWHPVLARGVPVRDDNGSVLFWAGINLDIAQQKQAELALLEADRHKNEFLAVLSHELRNPLTPIRNSYYVLERAAPGSDQAKHALDVIGRQTGQLARLVDDLLDLTRVSQNKIQIKRHRIELNDVVRYTIEDHRSLFEAKDIAVEVRLAPEQLPVNGDAVRLTQVLGNLLQNAAKYTQAGGRVEVGTTAIRSRGRAAFRVTDSGVGIEQAMLCRLFQPFIQADATLDRSKGGLGLGLALVKGLVELHGGEVHAYSQGPGKGAEFLVELPLSEAASTEAIPSTVRRVRRGRRVLIIEDNIDAADSLREVLELGEHLVEVAHNGPDGLAKAREFRPDVVLCDIGLPGMDGYEVARNFKADDALKGALLVALSGYAQPEDQQRAQAAGFERHLAKPPRLEKIQEILAEGCGVVADTADAEAGPGKSSSR